MLSRTFTPAGLSQRSHAQRRLRRSAASRRLLCSTNGCTTFMVLDDAGTSATCPICGSNKRIKTPQPEPVAARPH
jgi:hypothetical protein